MEENTNFTAQFTAQDAQKYIGKTQESDDVFDKKNLNLLIDSLGLEARDVKGEIPIPLHWLYHLESVRPEQIGRDGHPKVGIFMPPLPAKRRMFIGSEIIRLGAMKIGQASHRKRKILSIDEKNGKSGKLYLVKVESLFTDSGGAEFLREVQTIAYLDSWGTGRTKPQTPPEPKQAEFTANITPDNVMLFKFSALTFNSHKIHYDQNYARVSEHYPDIVIHGPLSATLLGYYAHLWLGKVITKFSFRTLAPLFLGEKMRIEATITAPNHIELWVVAPDGQIAVSASASA